MRRVALAALAAAAGLALSAPALAAQVTVGSGSSLDLGTVAVHGGEDLLRTSALGEARVAPDVDEEHRDLALTGGELDSARQLLGDRTRDIAAQRLLHRAALADHGVLVEVL